MEKNIKGIEQKIIDAIFSDEYLEAEHHLENFNSMREEGEAIDGLGNYLLEKAIEKAEEQNLSRAEELLKKRTQR